MTSTLIIRLSADMERDLEHMRKQESKTTECLIRKSLRGFLAVRSKILPFAEAQGLLTDEDVFQALSC